MSRSRNPRAAPAGAAAAATARRGFDNVESFGSSYATPGWQRAQANRNRGQAGRGQARGGFEEDQSPFSGERSDAPGARGDTFSGGGFSRNKRGPMVIEGELVAKSTGTVSEFNARRSRISPEIRLRQRGEDRRQQADDRVRKAGEKKVVDSFVERV
jgi:DNA helicase-2/ATP-dependent DNA helicase PcrA